MEVDAATTVVGSKITTSIASAGLLASIAQDPDFWVLFATAIIISIISFYHDLKDDSSPVKSDLWPSTLAKYVLSGLAVMFLTFYGLIAWIPASPQFPIPNTVWYMVAMVTSGYGMSIVTWAKGFLPSVANATRDKVIK
jgi:hypothetical protein